MAKKGKMVVKKWGFGV